MKLYLSDGYEIDEDEILLSSIARGQTLIMSGSPPEQRKNTDAQKNTEKGKMKINTN